MLVDRTFKAPQETSTADTNVTSSTPPALKFEISGKLKEVLCTNLGMCKEYMEKLFDQASHQKAQSC